MATILTKPVSRRVRVPRRDLIVTLVPAEDDALIEIREKGYHKGYAIHARSLFMLLAQRAADRALEEKRKERAMRRITKSKF